MLLEILVSTIAIGFSHIYFETNFPKINEINLKFNKPLPKEGINILQITDYHNFKHNKKILKLIDKTKADIIAITGDLIDKETKDYSNVYNLIENLVRLNSNIYYVPGNHELNNGGMKELISGIKKRKAKILLNENDTLEIRGKKINICGIDYSGRDSYDLDKAFKNIDKDLFTVLLSHKPDIVTIFKEFPCDLIICGHTHGGQVRLPFLGALIAPDQGAFPKYNKGLYRLTENTALYIDSGVGTTRIPVRTFNRSQISLIKCFPVDAL